MPANYVSLDIETTGLSATADQILEVGVVVETDWQTPVDQLPHLRLLVEHERIGGGAVALAMNARLIAELARSGRCAYPPEAVARLVGRFVSEHLPRTVARERVTLAGKNLAGFDLRFLERLPKWHAEFGFRIRRRVIDAGNLWWDPATDDALPDTETCLRRAGLTNDRPHEALEDARAVVKLVRRWYAHRERLPAATRSSRP